MTVATGVAFGHSVAISDTGQAPLTSFFGDEGISSSTWSSIDGDATVTALARLAADHSTQRFCTAPPYSVSLPATSWACHRRPSGTVRVLTTVSTVTVNANYSVAISAKTVAPPLSVAAPEIGASKRFTASSRGTISAFTSAGTDGTSDVPQGASDGVLQVTRPLVRTLSPAVANRRA